MHLGARAQGGSGLIMTESAAVAPEGLTTPQDTGMWNDEQQAVWTRIVEFGYSQGAAMAIHGWPTPDAMPDVSRLPRRARRLRPAR